MAQYASQYAQRNNTATKVEGNEVQAALAGGGAELYWPSNLSTVDHYMRFDIFNHEFRRATSPRKEDIKLSIKLPMTEALQLQQGQNYSSEELGAIGFEGASIASGAMQGGGAEAMLDRMSSVDGERIKTALKRIGLQALEGEVATIAGGAVSGPGGAVVAAGATQAFKGALGVAGVSRNPYQSVFYNAPNFRTYNFSWKLVPKDEKEQNDIQKIIKAFRTFSAPGTAVDGIFFTYPELFDIRFNHDKFLFKPKPCVCTSVEVAYHADGKLYHKMEEGTKAPVSMNLSLAFQEITIVTKQDIDKDH